MTKAVKIESGGGLTIGSLFHSIASITNLYDAWREFRYGKTKKIDIQTFELSLETNLFTLHEKIKTHTYQPQPYQSFFVKDPKLRHIHKACVTDRVLHQAVFRQLYPLVDKHLSSSVYSARSNKGTHKGVKKLFITLRKESHNWKKETRVLKCDIRKFFDSIDHKILKQKLKQFDFDKDTEQLVEILIDSFKKTESKGLPLEM